MNATQGSFPHTEIFPHERRRYPRVRVVLQAELRVEGNDVPTHVQTTDISFGGCYVELAVTFDLGTRLDLVLWLGEVKAVAKGVVVTRHPQFGNGVEFVEMSAEHQARLSAFLQSGAGCQKAYASAL